MAAEFNLEIMLRAYMDLTKDPMFRGADSSSFWQFWSRAVAGFLNSNSQEITKEEFYRYYLNQFPDSVSYVITVMGGARGGPQEKEIENVVKFVAEQVFCPKQNRQSFGGNQYYDNTTYMQMFLNKLNQIEDKKLVYDALSFLKRYSGFKIPSNKDDTATFDKPARRAVYKDIATMLASNENASLDDICEMIYFVETPEDALKIINDVFARTDEELDKELNKDVPDTDKVRNILSNPSNVINRVLSLTSLNPVLYKILNVPRNEYYEEVKQWGQKAVDKYDFNKVVGSGDAKYITTYDDTLDKENIDLINKNETLEKEKNALEQSRDQFRDNYERAEEQRKKLEQKYDDERAARLSAEKMLQKALEVIAAYEKGEAEIDKAGVFNKGAAKVKMKKEVEDAQNELKRAKAEEAKRMADLVARQRDAGEAISI